uniref:response regulator transcription factor n=1 Tax=Enterocloster aldenensis TaxID=358742 RepID=UPI00356691CF
MNRYRILLADDEQIERMALAKRLVKHFGDSLAISEAVNGAEALKVFKREQSQIVLMDISMPEMNGAEAAEQIRGMDEDCIIIFLTAYDDFAYAKRAIVIRALDYLLKPCDEDELVSVIEEAMRLTDRRELKKARDFGMDGGKALDGDIPGVRGVSMAKIPSGGAQDMAGGHGLEDAGTARMALAAETMREYIRNNYMKEISMQDAARVMNYSDAYFCKLFKQCFDQNFTSYLTNFRVNEAKKLLKDRNISVKDVGMRVGYYDSNYLAKVFKRVTGVIPSEYRDSQHSIRHGDANRPT